MKNLRNGPDGLTAPVDSQMRQIWGTWMLMAFLQTSTTTWRTEGAILPPPWADPSFNPCAALPGGWQLIHWPPDKKCYRIFTRGYPCPESMELTPGPDKGTPECNCPPGTAQISPDSRCYALYERQPCERGEYFAPMDKSGRGRWGTCRKAEPCSGRRQLLWPKDDRCYPRNGRAPCPEGKLLTLDPDSSSGGGGSFIGKCDCRDDGDLAPYFWPQTGTCHEFYTVGPCQERGDLFLPGAVCGCSPKLPNYHPATGKCYQIGGSGPCPIGHHFVLPDPAAKYAECTCKEDHVKWAGDGACYRPFSRGPCAAAHMFSVNVTATGMAIGCVDLPCPPGKLYFPGVPGNVCHRIGTPGPCPEGQVVLFQDSAKTSAEGVSYLGMCGCPGNPEENGSFFPTIYKMENGTVRCAGGGHSFRSIIDGTITAAASKENKNGKGSDACGGKRGVIAWPDGSCKQLYSQGPCGAGEWVVPDRSKGQRKGRGWKIGKCECRPGFAAVPLTATTDGNNSNSNSNNNNKIVCQAPFVTIAKFLTTAVGNKTAAPAAEVSQEELSVNLEDQ